MNRKKYNLSELPMQIIADRNNEQLANDEVSFTERNLEIPYH